MLLPILASSDGSVSHIPQVIQLVEAAQATADAVRELGGEPVESFKPQLLALRDRFNTELDQSSIPVHTGPVKDAPLEMTEEKTPRTASAEQSLPTRAKVEEAPKVQEATKVEEKMRLEEAGGSRAPPAALAGRDFHGMPPYAEYRQAAPPSPRLIAYPQARGTLGLPPPMSWHQPPPWMQPPSQQQMFPGMSAYPFMPGPLPFGEMYYQQMQPWQQRRPPPH